MEFFGQLPQWVAVAGEAALDVEEETIALFHLGVADHVVGGEPGDGLEHLLQGADVVEEGLVHDVDDPVVEVVLAADGHDLGGWVAGGGGIPCGGRWN